MIRAFGQRDTTRDYFARAVEPDPMDSADVWNRWDAIAAACEAGTYLAPADAADVARLVTAAIDKHARDLSDDAETPEHAPLTAAFTAAWSEARIEERWAAAVAAGASAESQRLAAPAPRAVKGCNVVGPKAAAPTGGAPVQGAGGKAAQKRAPPPASAGAGDAAGVKAPAKGAGGGAGAAPTAKAPAKGMGGCTTLRVSKKAAVKEELNDMLPPVNLDAASDDGNAGVGGLGWKFWGLGVVRGGVEFQQREGVACYVSGRSFTVRELWCALVRLQG